MNSTYIMCTHNVTRQYMHVYMLQEQYSMCTCYKNSTCMCTSYKNCTHCVHVTTIEAYVYKGNLHNFWETM